MKKIRKYFEGRMTEDGAGVRLRRCFGYYEIPEFDPFLMMDFFDSKDPKDYLKGFPMHPHRGIETITYLIDGEIHHEDSLGNRGAIKGGQCQWMRAGSGILHQEMPQAGDLLLGSQIWLNMPKAEKMTNPEYRDITRENIGSYQEEGLDVKVLAGSYKGVRGPIERDLTDPSYLDVGLEAKKTFSYETREGYTLILFLIRGRAKIGHETLEAPMGILYEREGSKIEIQAEEEDLRFLLLSGRPLGEEIAWGGPIVMNTKEELNLAFEELKSGLFIKP